VQSHGALYGVNQFARVVSDAFLEDELDIFEVRDFLAGVSLDHHEVCALPWLEGADAVGFAQKLLSVLRGDVNGFERSEASFHQELDLSLVAEARDDPASTFFSRSEKSGLIPL
jgi:hypothetical protein